MQPSPTGKTVSVLLPRGRGLAWVMAVMGTSLCRVQKIIPGVSAQMSHRVVVAHDPSARYSAFTGASAGTSPSPTPRRGGKTSGPSTQIAHWSLRFPVIVKLLLRRALLAVPLVLAVVTLTFFFIRM